MITLTDTYIHLNEPSAIALGTFDGLHIGHRAVIDSMLCYAKANGVSSLIYAISGGKCADMLMTEDIKKDILSDIGIDYYAVPVFDEIKHLSPQQFVRDILRDSLNAKAVFCGENYRFGRGACASAHDMSQLCSEYGIYCQIIESVKLGGQTVSSSAIRLFLENGDVESANLMLGTPYTIKQPVVTGKKIGHLLGTPTINQPCPKGLIMPKRGVYASFALLDGKRYSAVTNFGIKPTVGGCEAPLYETWIMDFCGDLYGRTVSVSLLKYLREEIKFDDLEQLKNQIIADGINSRAINIDYFTDKI